MERPVEGGGTVRDQLEAVKRMTGRAPAELIGPELPDHLAYLMAWFDEIDAGRGSSGMGPAPLSSLEIRSWAELAGVRLEPWEHRALRVLDNAYLVAMAERPSEGDEPT
jgi:hypothetical protein